MTKGLRGTCRGGQVLGLFFGNPKQPAAPLPTASSAAGSSAVITYVREVRRRSMKGTTFRVLDAGLGNLGPDSLGNQFFKSTAKPQSSENPCFIPQHTMETSKPSSPHLYQRTFTYQTIFTARKKESNSSSQTPFETLNSTSYIS